MGDLTTISEHHTYEQVRGKEIVRINELNSLLRNSTKTKSRGDTLLFLEGGQAVANKKHGEITSIDTAKTSVIMTGNIEPEDEQFMRNDPLMARVQLITTENNIEFNEIYTDKAAKTECPIILLFCGMCSMSIIGRKLDYIPQPVIHDILEGEELEYIE